MGSAQAENGFGGPEAACHVPREAVLHLTLVENCRAEDKWVPVGLKVMNVEVYHQRLPLGVPDKAADRRLIEFVAMLRNHLASKSQESPSVFVTLSKIGLRKDKTTTRNSLQGICGDD